MRERLQGHKETYNQRANEKYHDNKVLKGGYSEERGCVECGLLTSFNR